MPTIKNLPSEYRFFFYSFDCNEPIHVHVQKGKKVCKFWLEPISLSKNFGFSSKDLNKIRKTIKKNQKHIMESWYEHCG